MRFLTKDVNRGLLVVLTFFLIVFVIFTVYYGTKFRNIINEKNNEKANMVTAELVLEKLNRSDQLKEIAIIDKAVLEEKYIDLVALNDNIKKEKAALQEEVILLKSEMEYQQAKLEGPVAQFRLIQDKNQEIKNLNEKIRLLCSKLKNYNDSAEGCS